MTKNYSEQEIKKMVGSYYKSGTIDSGQTVFVKETNKKVKSMISKIKDLYKNGDWYKESLEIQFQTPIKLPIEITKEMNYHIGYVSDTLYEYFDDNFNLQLFGFDDGIMIHSLIVREDKKGKGIGTDIMNKLYDISEDMEVPLYLIPFPAGDNFEQSKIYDIINPLKKWYDKIGFGHLTDRGMIWCNY